MSASTDVRIFAANGPHSVSVIKASFQPSTIVVSTVEPTPRNAFPIREEHLTYPPDGQVHLTVTNYESWPDDHEFDPLNLYDMRGKKPRMPREPGPPLVTFTGRYTLRSGFIFMSGEVMRSLPPMNKTKKAHDLTVIGIGDGVAFGYAVDILEPDPAILSAAIEHRRQEAESLNEAFRYRLVSHTRPNLLISLRAKHLLDQPTPHVATAT